MKKLILTLGLIIISLIGYSQKSVEFTIGFGYTIIDVEELVEVDEISSAFAEDWTQVNYGVSGQFFFASFGIVQLGAEFMYHSLYYYQVGIPRSALGLSGSGAQFRDYYVSATRITPILRFGGDGVFNFDVGPELNFLDNTEIGVMASGNYNISVSDKMVVPIKLRVDVFNNIVSTIPISVHGGIRLNL